MQSSTSVEPAAVIANEMHFKILNLTQQFDQNSEICWELTIQGCLMSESKSESNELC